VQATNAKPTGGKKEIKEKKKTIIIKETSRNKGEL
jgi:hypothetical protein